MTDQLKSIVDNIETTGGAAFPLEFHAFGGGTFFFPGLTKRELFAALMMHSFVTSSLRVVAVGGPKAEHSVENRYAELSVRYADTLLAELAASENNSLNSDDKRDIPAPTEGVTE